MGRKKFLSVASMLAVLAVARGAGAVSIKVSANGADSATCGVAANPACATIAQAVSNAVDGDSILVGPGSYAGTTVGKSLKLWSSGGNGAANIVSTMTLSADGSLFGKPGKGFSIGVEGGTAIVVSGNLVTVRGNLVNQSAIGVDCTGYGDIIRDNSFEWDGTGVRVSGDAAEVSSNRFGYTTGQAILLEATSTAAEVSGNRTSSATAVGVTIGGANHIVRRNLVHGSVGGGFVSSGGASNVQLVENLVVRSYNPAFNLAGGSGWILKGNAAVASKSIGFYLQPVSPMTLVNNSAIGNMDYGIVVIGGGDHVLTGNSAINNGGNGIGIMNSSSGLVITGGNVYGNAMNCGVSLASGNPLTVTKTYWGAAGGPGADPADAACDNVALLTVSNPAAAANPIKMPPVK